MIAICVGIVQPGTLSLSRISCAGEDATRVYHALAQATVALFDHVRSLCLTDCSVGEAKSYIAHIARKLTSEDTLVIYYSGHATFEGTKLVLAFGDANDEGVGRMTPDGLAELVGFCKGQTIMILDCCHAGIALKIANKEDSFERLQISVLASTQAHRPSTFTESGSTFTNALCFALTLLHEQRLALSLSVIAKLIRESGGTDCVLNLAEGQVEVVIPSSLVPANLSAAFPLDYVDRLCRARLAIREMLWYSLSELPIDTRMACLTQYFGRELSSEPSWVVRRACGSLLWSCRTDRAHWYQLVESLLTAPNWMEVCVGLIGARGEIVDARLQGIASDLLVSDAQVDAVWLAHLYLSDVGVDVLERAIHSRLARTSWGVVDIASRQVRSAEDVLTVLPVFREYLREDEILRALGTHLRCLGLPFSADGWQLPYDPDVSDSPLVRYLYASGRRGRIVDSGTKWLLSYMYGSWRDQLQENVTVWLENHSDEQCRIQLQVCARVPSVEVRMAVFQDLRHAGAVFARYQESVAWGLEDPHPWVRREALVAFRRDSKMTSKALEVPLNSALYPGCLDFWLAAHTVGASPAGGWVGLDLTNSEKRAMDWAVGVEK